LIVCKKYDSAYPQQPIVHSKTLQLITTQLTLLQKSKHDDKEKYFNEEKKIAQPKKTEMTLGRIICPYLLPDRYRDLTFVFDELNLNLEISKVISTINSYENLCGIVLEDEELKVFKIF